MVRVRVRARVRKVVASSRAEGRRAHISIVRHAYSGKEGLRFKADVGVVGGCRVRIGS